MNDKATFKVYQASAGSGKTYTIVLEYLKLCLSQVADTDNFKNILAITFTNKAANEMKAKIINQLQNIIESDTDKAPEGMERDLLQQLGIERKYLKNNAQRLFQSIIHDYSSFNVCTIDAFVQKLSRSFAKDLNLPNQYNVSIDDDEIATAVTQRIGEQLGKDNPLLNNVLSDFVKLRLEDDQSGQVQNALYDFATTLLKEDAYEKNAAPHFKDEKEYLETLRYIKKTIDDFRATASDLLSAYQRLTEKYALNDEDFFHKSTGVPGFFKKLKNNIFDRPNSYVFKFIDESVWYNTATKKNNVQFNQIDQEMCATLLPLFEKYNGDLPQYQFLCQQKPQLCLYVLRSKLKTELEALISEEQVVHISEFNKRISDVMGDFSVPFVYERIGEQYKHVFIDEFQDTSILQWQNLIPLVDNSLSNNAMSMVVGDGKQSIYRFRSGEVEQLVQLPEIYRKPTDSDAFDTFENNLKTCFHFTNLGTNYRSFHNIVTFNNCFFETVVKNLPQSIQKVYHDKNEQFKKEVCIAQKPHHEEEGLVQVELYDKTVKDTDIILERIKTLIEEIMAHGFSYNDITLLVRDNKKGSLIANYLNSNNIPVVSSDSILLQSSDKVLLVINTLYYLIHSDNEANIADLIHKWHVTHDDGNFEQLAGLFDTVGDIASNRKDIETAIHLEAGYLHKLLSKSYSLYDLCAALMHSFGFDSTQDPYLNYLLEEVYLWQSKQELGIAGFLDYWEKKKDRLAVRSSDSDAITVMTIHKAKGLEFNVVIYPFACNNLADRFGNEVWEKPETFGMSAIPNVDKVKIRVSSKMAEWNDKALSYYQKEKESAELDDLNIMYVAFTRAVQRLYVLATRTESKGEPEKQIIERALIDAENSIIAAESDTEHTVYRFGNPEAEKVRQHDKDLSLKELHLHDTPSAGWLGKIQIDPNPSAFWASKTEMMQPQEWGDLVHKILSGVGTIDDIEKALKPFVDNGSIDTEHAMQLEKQFLKIAMHPLIAPAFGEQAIVKNECEVLSPKFGILRPDRYAELPDRILLIDYKTGKQNPSHHQQLKDYATVLSEMVDKDIKPYLVYIGDTIEVEEVGMM